MTAPQAGDVVLERFRLDRPLSSGAMGQVWAGVSLDDGVPVAVKITDEENRARARSEAAALERLEHPGVVPFVAAGPERSTEVLVMGLVDGVPLSKHIGGDLAPDVAEAMDLARQLAEALAHAHERGVVHRDVKASNVVVVPDRSGHRAVLVDFGIGLVEGCARVSSHDVVLGSSHTMPPENVQGRPASPKADVYSLGALLFRMVAGRYPFHASSPVQVLAMHVHAQVPTLAQRARRTLQVPAGLEALLGEMLAKEPDARPSAADVADRLSALGAVPRSRWIVIRAESEGSVSDVAPPARPALPVNSRRLVQVASLATGVMVASWIVWWFLT